MFELVAMLGIISGFFLVNYIQKVIFYVEALKNYKNQVEKFGMTKRQYVFADFLANSVRSFNLFSSYNIYYKITVVDEEYAKNDDRINKTLVKIRYNKKKMIFFLSLL